MKTITNNFEGFLLSTFNYKEKTYLIYYVNSNRVKYVKVYKQLKNNKTLINSYTIDLKTSEIDIEEMIMKDISNNKKLKREDFKFNIRN